MITKAVKEVVKDMDEVVTRRILAEELIVFEDRFEKKIERKLDFRFDEFERWMDEKFETFIGVMREQIDDMFKANMEGINMKIEAIDRKTDKLSLIAERLENQNHLTQFRINRLENKVFKKKLS